MPEAALDMPTNEVGGQMDSQALAALNMRLGEDYVAYRLTRQVEHVAYSLGPNGPRLYWENMKWMPAGLKLGLSAIGCLEKAIKHANDIAVESRELTLDSLPAAFDGYRILHLSDLHLDGAPDAGENIINCVQNIEADLCVITGDFRFETFGDYRGAVRSAIRLVDSLRCSDGVLGILGNHDFIEMVPGLESGEMRLLLNERHSVQRDGEELHIVGVDDPHYYAAHNFDAACAGLPRDACSLLLAHSAEIAKEANAWGFDAYFCGHSHGGQVCLPGGIPIIKNTRAARDQLAGAWRSGQMHGYTSRGTGASGLWARVFCPPEVTVHTLRTSVQGPTKEPIS